MEIQDGGQVRAQVPAQPVKHLANKIWFSLYLPKPLLNLISKYLIIKANKGFSIIVFFAEPDFIDPRNWSQCYLYVSQLL